MDMRLEFVSVTKKTKREKTWGRMAFYILIDTAAHKHIKIFVIKHSALNSARRTFRWNSNINSFTFLDCT